MLYTSNSIFHIVIFPGGHVFDNMDPWFLEISHTYHIDTLITHEPIKSTVRSERHLITLIGCLVFSVLINYDLENTAGFPETT